MTVHHILRDLFHGMRKRNPSFSLRAFARRLGTDPSSMSKILKGHRVPSPQTVERWIEKLSLTPEEASSLRSALTKTGDFTPLASELFEANYNWAHPILLEFLRIPGSETRLSALTSFLKMSVEDIERELAILEGHQIVRKNTTEPGYSTAAMSTVHIPYTTERRKQLQHKYLDLAIEALHEIPLDLRDNSTLTFAIHTEDIQTLKEILQETRTKINKLSARHPGKANVVYNFTSALYPVIKELS